MPVSLYPISHTYTAILPCYLNGVIAPAFFCNGQCDIERFTGYRTFTVNLNMHTVYEQDRVVTLKAGLQPGVYLGTNAIDHPADAGLGIVLAVNLLKDNSDLFLCKSFGI